MELKRNSDRSVLSELKLSNAENIEHSFKKVSKAAEFHWHPESRSHSGTNRLVIESQKPSNLSNLELLTKVASRVKNDSTLFEDAENIADPCVQAKDPVDVSCKPRKEKSLSILCDKFLKLYPLNVSSGNCMEISLDQATQFIGTDRRRIYDILIVLECLQMASKVCKNHYQWHGTQHLIGTLSQLKWLALRLNFFQNINTVLMEDSPGSCEEWTSETESSDLNVMDPLSISTQAQNILSCNSNYPPSCESVSTQIKGASRCQKPEDDADFDLKDSSLGIMCQKFLMLFLVTSKVITLDNAAKILLGDTEGLSKDCHKVKTKIRRLYDIANVLSSLELIKKVNVSAGNSITFGSFIRMSKKPAFQYIGPEVQPKPLPNDALFNLQTTRHSLLGHPSHAACEKKSTRKRKPKNPCPLLPKPGNVLKENSTRSEASFCGEKRSWLSAFPSGGRNTPGREKFPRSHSENCINETPQLCGALRSDILQVAELELKRIADEEEREKEISSVKTPIAPSVVKNIAPSPKCHWKHYHSENCISVNPGIEKDSGNKNLSPNVVSWKSSILKPSNSKLNSNLEKELKITSRAVSQVADPQWQSIGSTRKDVSICIINSSSVANKLEGNFKTFSGKATVPIVIHSMQKSSRLRSICINPVPITGSNCVVGPAYIIHQLPSGSSGNLNPVSVRMAEITRGSSSKSLGGINVCNNAV